MADPLTVETLRALFLPATDTSARAELWTLTKVALAAEHDAETELHHVPDRERWILNVRYTGGISPSEQHRDWHDLSLYLAGGNDLRVGGTLEDPDEISDGEQRNGTLTGGVVFPVRAGDLIWTPAGVPHQSHFLFSTAFVIVKLRRGEIPAFTLPAHLTTGSAARHIAQFRLENFPIVS